jgi:hypothetical protein
MHGTRSPVSEVHYGSGGDHLFLRIDFHETKEEALGGVEIRLKVQGPATFDGSLGVFDCGPAGSFITGTEIAGAQCAFRKILEAGIPLTAVGAASGQPIEFQFSLWKDGLPMDAIPQQGWLKV